MGSYPAVPTFAANSFATSTELNQLGTATSFAVQPTTAKLATGSGGAGSAAEVVIGTFAGAIPANDPSVGGGYRWRVYGSADEVGTPTVTFRLRLDTVAGTTVISHTAITANQGAGRPYTLEGFGYFTAIGGSGNLDADERVHELLSGTGNGTLNQTFGFGVTVDTTVAHDVVITAQFSASNAGNLARTLAGSFERICY